MTQAADDWNANIINEFRSNGGEVGGNFTGAPMTLLHHTGRKSGRQTVSPVMYLADADDPATIYVFASAAGAKSSPAWYYNLTAAGTGTIEVGTDTVEVTVEEITGADRDRIYAEQARRYPGFAEYEQKTAGIRTIPVLALHRATSSA
jgi:deazaflavin-dependent oxidoreductase (nitroreductase family)